jgi:hypothetical protein
MAGRTVEDRLREEYFGLLPDARRVLEELEAEVRHALLPKSGRLDRYERLVVTSRIKDCKSALEALRRRHRADLYTLAALNDLAGVGVLAFPLSRWIEADRELRGRFSSWTSDPVPADEGGEEPLAFKYHCHCSGSARLRGELQIVCTTITDGRSVLDRTPDQQTKSNFDRWPFLTLFSAGTSPNNSFVCVGRMNSSVTLLHSGRGASIQIRTRSTR